MSLDESAKLVLKQLIAKRLKEEIELRKDKNEDCF